MTEPLELSPKYSREAQVARSRARVWEPKPRQLPDAEVLVTRVCQAFNVTRGELKNSSRHASILPARYAACWLLRHKRGLTLTQIGQKLNRDHSTVFASIEKARAMLRDDAGFRERVAGI